jgi:hypothetical protein
LLQSKHLREHLYKILEEVLRVFRK